MTGLNGSVPPLEKTVPNREYLDGKTPFIILAEDKWPVPKLAIRQNRHIVGNLVKLLPRFTALMAFDDKGEAKVDPAKAMLFMSSIDDDAYDLLTDSVFWALKRAHPGLVREEFDDMPIGLLELFSAFETIIQQAGMFVKKDAPPPGEALAEPRPTGIE